MRRTILPILGSMLALSIVVNTSAKDNSSLSGSSANELKDSIKDNSKSDLSQLIDYMMKHSPDDRIGENLAPVIGLSGPMPVKAELVRNKIHNNDRDALNCALVLEETSDGQRPNCIFLMKRQESGHDIVSQYFHVTLDGKLDRVMTLRTKKGEDGKTIPGSAVSADDDKDSPAVRKTYAAEMREVRIWLKTQQKLIAKGANSGSAKQR